MMPKIVFAANKLMTYSILGLCFFLLLMSFFFIYKQKNHKKKSFLFFRFLCYLIAIISLALAGLQPQIQSSVFIKNTAIILNNPNSLASLANIIKNSSTSPTIFSIKNQTQASQYDLVDSLKNYDIHAIPNLSYLAKQKGIKNKFNSLSLVGEGLEKHELAVLDSFPKVKLYLNKAPHGIHSLAWQRHLQLGKTLVLQGNFYHEKAKTAYKIYLNGFGQTLDSVLITPTKNKEFSEFRLQHRNKQVGKQVLELVIKNEAGKIFSQHEIPFISHKQNVNSILILASEPSFEIKFLKAFLAKKQFELAIRSKISRDIYKTEYFNLKNEKDLKNISSNLLNSFDCVILDIETLKDLSAEEAKNLKKACQNQGLAVLLLLEQNFVKKEFIYTNFLAKQALFQNFELKKNNLLQQNKIILQEKENKNNQVLNAINLKYFFEAKANQKTIFQTTTAQNIIAFQQKGLGKVSINTIPKTYLWALSGNEADYEIFWQVVLENLIVNYTNNSDFVLKEQLPIIDFPLHFRYQNQLKNDVIIWQNPKGENFELASSELLNEIAFAAKFWPKQAGWHRLFLKDKTAQKLDFYVYKKSNWQTCNSAKKIVQTNSYLLDNQDFITTLVKPKLEDKKTQNVSLFWFYITFFMSISALWVSEKFMR